MNREEFVEFSWFGLMFIIEDGLIDSGQEGGVAMMGLLLLSFEEELKSTEEIFGVGSDSLVLFFLLWGHFLDHFHWVEGLNVGTGLKGFHHWRLSRLKVDIFYAITVLVVLEVEIG